MKKKVYIIVNEHFDIMWRRCFDRDFEFKNENYISYADLEGYYIMDNIDLCDKYPYYKFTVECVAVLKKFLEHHPEYEEKIKELFEEKRIFVTMSGNNIIDSNMVQGESLVRNYLYGLEYLKDKYDYVPYGLDRNDAFGNSGQLPQIARGFNNKWVYHLVYSVCDNEYWRGIDGSTLYWFEPKSVGGTGGYYKYAPCPVCKGYKDKPCPACNNRRIDVPKMENIRTKIKLNEEFIKNSPIPGYVRIGGEEILPIDNINEWIEENKDKYDIEFASFEIYKEYIKDKLDRVDEVREDELHSMAEVNPNNTGTYVTRIETKKCVRENENYISLAETLGTLNGVNGGKYNTDFIVKMWEKLLFCMFHDAITATHIDAAYKELMEVHNSLMSALQYSIKESKKQLTVKNDNIVTVLNLLGADVQCVARVFLESGFDVTLEDENGTRVSVIKRNKTDDRTELLFVAGEIKAFGSKKFKIVPFEENKTEVLSFGEIKSVDGDAVLTNVVENNDSCNDENTVVIENEYYTVTANENGIREIYDKKLKKTIAEKSTYYVGEFILEHDEGSPWATLSNDMRRHPMSVNTKLVGIEKNEDYQEFVFKVQPGDLCAYAVNSFKAEYRVRVQRGESKVRFNTNVFWDTQNYRLRIAFPTTIKGRHIYEIPYGYIERKPYEPDLFWANSASNWASAAGDWPAINWAGIEADYMSVALLNKGTPSYQINTDDNGVENIYLTVLRSPSVGTYLHDPGSAYSMTDYDGMRDAGDKRFEYAFVSYDDGFDKNRVVTDSIAYNTETVALLGDTKKVYMPEIISDDVRIAAVKHSQKGDMLIYRLVEYHGNDSEFTLKIPEELNVKEVFEMNLNEEILSNIPLNNNTAVIKTGKFKITTIAFDISK